MSILFRDSIIFILYIECYDILFGSSVDDDE